jgi:hypothetical protein
MTQQHSDHDELWRHLDWSFWGTGMADTFREPLAETMLAAITPEQRQTANEVITWWRTRREFVGRDKYEEQKAEIEQLRAHLALATVLEIPRPIGFPLQLRRSHGHADRWAICDRTGRRWARDGGWWYDPAREEDCDRTRFSLTEALPLAHAIAAGTTEDAANPWGTDATWPPADDPAADAEGLAEQAAEHLPHD